MKKALIYDPYIDTMGGGERYCLTFASAIKSVGYSVTFAWPDRRTLSQAHDRFNLESDFECDAIAYDVFNRGSLLSKWNLTKQYDLVFFVSDGSLPYLFGKTNFVHFQVPFKKIGGNYLNNLIKASRIHKLIFNSQFTSDVIKKQLPYTPSEIMYPPIDTDNFTSGKKENLILSVARFDSPSHAKRQDILIECFSKLHQDNKDYKLILAGGLKGGADYLLSLKDKSGNLPIEIIPNPHFNELKKLYAKAKIFWHAAGYGIEESKEPEKVEHFGMTTVEAMSAGVIPVVIDKGGQREIITPDTGILCNSIEDMVTKTLSVISSPERSKALSQNCINRSDFFSQSRFIDQVTSLLDT